MIVVDTNVIAALWVPNHQDELVYKVLKKDAEWVAPYLWRSEFRNVLSLYYRQKIMPFELITLAMQEAETFMQSRTFEVDSRAVFEKMAQSSCSSCDAEFIALADERSVPLITFDKKILKNFSTIAVHPKNYI